MGVLIEMVGFTIAWFLGLYGFMVVYVCHIHEPYQIHHSDSWERLHIFVFQRNNHNTQTIWVQREFLYKDMVSYNWSLISL